MHSRRAHGAARVQVGHASVSSILALRFLRELLTCLRALREGLLRETRNGERVTAQVRHLCCHWLHCETPL